MGSKWTRGERHNGFLGRGAGVLQIYLPDQIPDDWYATAFDVHSAEMVSTDRTGPEVDQVAKILQPLGDERVLDKACGSGSHSLELRRL